MKISQQLIDAVEQVLVDLGDLIAKERARDSEFDQSAKLSRMKPGADGREAEALHFDSKQHGLKGENKNVNFSAEQRALLAYWNIFACAREILVILARSENKLKGKDRLSSYTYTCYYAGNALIYDPGAPLARDMHAVLYRAAIAGCQIPDEEIHEFLDGVLPLLDANWVVRLIKSVVGLIPGVSRKAINYVSLERVNRQGRDFLPNLKTDGIGVTAMAFAFHELRDPLGSVEYVLERFALAHSSERGRRLQAAFENKYPKLKITIKNQVRFLWFWNAMTALELGKVPEPLTPGDEQQQAFLQQAFAEIKREQLLAVPVQLIAKVVEKIGPRDDRTRRNLRALFNLLGNYVETQRRQKVSRMVEWCHLPDLAAELQRTGEQQAEVLDAYNRAVAVLLEQYEIQRLHEPAQYPEQIPLLDKVDRLINVVNPPPEHFWQLRRFSDDTSLLDANLLTEEYLSTVQSEFHTLYEVRECLLAKDLVNLDLETVKQHYREVSWITYQILVKEYYRDAIVARLEWRDPQNRSFIEVMHAVGKELTEKYTGKYTDLIDSHLKPIQAIRLIHGVVYELSLEDCLKVLRQCQSVLSCISEVEQHCINTFGEDFKSRWEEDARQLQQEFQHRLPINAEVELEKLRHLRIIGEAKRQYEAIQGLKWRLERRAEDFRERGEAWEKFRRRPSVRRGEARGQKKQRQALIQPPHTAEAAHTNDLPESTVKKPIEPKQVHTEKAIPLQTGARPQDPDAPVDPHATAIQAADDVIRVAQDQLSAVKESVEQTQKALSDHEQTHKSDDECYPENYSEIKQDHDNHSQRLAALEAEYEDVSESQATRQSEHEALTALAANLLNKDHLEQHFCELFPLIAPHLETEESSEKLKADLVEHTGRLAWSYVKERETIRHAIITAAETAKAQQEQEAQRAQAIKEKLPRLQKTIEASAEQLATMHEEAKAYEETYQASAQAYSEKIATQQQQVEALEFEIQQHTILRELSGLNQYLEPLKSEVEALNESLAVVDTFSSSDEQSAALAQFHNDYEATEQEVKQKLALAALAYKMVLELINTPLNSSANLTNNIENQQKAYLHKGIQLNLQLVKVKRLLDQKTRTLEQERPRCAATTFIGNQKHDGEMAEGADRLRSASVADAENQEEVDPNAHRREFVNSLKRRLDNYQQSREKKYRKKDFLRRALWLVVGAVLSLTLVGIVYWFKCSLALDKVKRRNNTEKLKAQLDTYADEGTNDSRQNILATIHKAAKKFPPRAKASSKPGKTQEAHKQSYQWCLFSIRQEIELTTSSQAPQGVKSQFRT